MSVGKRSMFLAAFALLMLPVTMPLAADVEADSEELPADLPPEVRARIEALRSLDWVSGPTMVEVAGNSRLEVPEGYVFLDEPNTTRYLELNQNLGDGTEVMIAPESREWEAYLSFADEGYVKDDEKDKLDADAILKSAVKPKRWVKVGTTAKINAFVA